MKTGGSTAGQRLIAELCHEINSPLAAIRNALYLSAARSQDPEVLHYLGLANAEINTITAILRQAREILEGTVFEDSREPVDGRLQEHRRAAA